MDAYESLGAIGEGTYGVVIRARHKATGQVVAIKRFKESEEDEQTRKTSLREVRVLKQLRHDNVVGLLDVFRRKGKLHIVFEYIEKTILEVLDATPRGIDPLSVKKYMYQLLRGLEFCHSQNIVHRDVKPENILISERGTLKICDFGFARPMVNGGKYTDYVATRWYRAPELLVGDVEYGKGVDVWAVGCIFSEISTGQPLFPGESDFDQLAHILRCCGKLPQRFVQIFYKNPLYKNVDLPPQRIVESLDERFRHPPSSCWLQFMKSCLRCDPGDRDTCTSLLQSPYFDDTSDFTKAKYEAYLQTVYEQEQHLRSQLMAVSPPPPVPQGQQGQPPPQQQVSGQGAVGAPQRQPGAGNAFLPDLGRAGSAAKAQEAQPVDNHIIPQTTTNTTPVVANNPKAPQSTLWSQYLASASHELPELGAKPSLGMPSLGHHGLTIGEAGKAGQVVDKGQPYTMKTTSTTTKLPTALGSMPPLQTGGASYRLPTLDNSAGTTTLYSSTLGGAKAPTPPTGGAMKVKDSNARTSLTLSTSGPPLTEGHKSPTPPNSLSVVGQGGGKTSPSPSTVALTSQLTYKKKANKKNVLSSLTYTSYDGPQPQSSGLTIGGAKAVGGLNSGLDPFGGGMFAPNGTGLPRTIPVGMPTNTSPYSFQERHSSNANFVPTSQSPTATHLYDTGGGGGGVDAGRLSDLIMKGRTQQQQQQAPGRK